MIPFLAFFAFVAFVAEKEAQAETTTIPLKSYRGWWYGRFPNNTSRIKLRIKIPYEMPAPVHFHILAFPEINSTTFTGVAPWPKGWIWHRGNPALKPISSPEVVVKTIGGMPYRVAPSVLTSPGTVGRTAFGQSGYTLLTAGVNSEFTFHGNLNHSGVPPVEFMRGSWTPWLDLTGPLGSLPPQATSVMIAIAPYHIDGTGEDQAINLYPPKDSVSTTPFHPRKVGDYPNDPTLLWNFHHESSGNWKNHAIAEWVEEVAKSFSYEAVRFPSAWLAGANQFDRWVDVRLGDSVRVDLQRPTANLTLQRSSMAEYSIYGLTRNFVKFPASLVSMYLDHFGGGVVAPVDAVFAPPSTIGLPVFDNPDVKNWMADRGGPKMDLLRSWLAIEIGAEPDFLHHFETWILRVAEWHRDGLSAYSFSIAIEFAYYDFFLEHTGSFLGLIPFGPGTKPTDVVGFIFDHLKNDFGAAPGMSYFIEPIFDPASQKTDEAKLSLGLGLALPSEDLRPPLAWAFVLPPVFGQMEALASPELMNLSFTWWRSAVSGVFDASSLSPPVTYDPVKFPWKGWFPIGNGPWENHAGSWWYKYQKMPWAHLLVSPTMPNWTTGRKFDGTTLEWRNFFSQKIGWGPQPPAARESVNGDDFARLTLPTAAYLLGPIEIKVTP